MKLSKQQLEIYLLLKENMGRETSIDEITEIAGLNIRGYTERISELRSRGYFVKNTRKGFYILESEPMPTLDDLRIIWTEAKKRGYKKLMARCQEKGLKMRMVEQIKIALF